MIRHFPFFLALLFLSFGFTFAQKPEITLTLNEQFMNQLELSRTLLSIIQSAGSVLAGTDACFRLVPGESFRVFICADPFEYRSIAACA